MNKKIIIAPVGDYMDDLYVSIKEFPTEKIILMTPKDRVKDAQDAKDSLEKFKIPTKIMEIEGNLWEEIFKTVSKIKEYEKGDLLINVSTGDRESRCAATSAAFVNGIKAFAIGGNEVMMLPVLKFSYYNLLTDKKMGILRTLYECKDCFSSLEKLSKKTKMSIPLLSYHINGNLKSEGLKEMGLVETEEIKGKMKVNLSFLGKMLLKGYVK
jgi:DNA-binding transcriptional ArsR family regulator